MTSYYMIQEKRFQQIINNNIKSAIPDVHVKHLIYYNNKKLKNLLISNNNHKYKEHIVVYQFTCEREPCNQAQFYIGYTTTTVKSRLTAHAQQGSIKKHIMEVPLQSKVATQEIMKNITILRKIPNPNDVQIAEALLIKENKPTLNNQNEFSERTLKVFQIIVQDMLMTITQNNYYKEQPTIKQHA